MRGYGKIGGIGKRMIRLLIYDLDGTLIDSRRDIANAVNWTLEEMGFSALPQERVQCFVGSGVRNLMEDSLRESGAFPDGEKTPELSKLADRAIQLFRRRYGNHLLEETRLYPSVMKVLETFRDRRQAVITNKPEDFSLTILEGLGIRNHFFSVLGGDAGFPKKPAPEGARELLRRAGVSAEEALLIGDSAIDVETGRNAGIATMAVTYGFGKRKEIEAASPHYLIDDLEEIFRCPLLKEIR